MTLLRIPGTIQHIRRTKAGVELATVTMKSAGGDRTVTLIGVQHIATQDFWARDIAHLRELEASGAKLFLEGVRPLEGEVTAEEQERISSIRGFSKVQALLAEVTGLTHQKDAFAEAGATWVPYDVSILEFVRGLKPRALRKLQKASKLDEEIFRDSPELALALLRLLPLIPTALSRILSGDLTKQIIDRRNEYAVAGVLASSVEHAVLYWGAAHLSGMMKLLRERGYSVTDEEWRLVLPASHKVPEELTEDDDSPSQ